MNDIFRSRKFWYLVVCWTARILAGLLAALIVAFAIGEGMPNPFTQMPLPERVESLGMFFIFLGLIIGFKWQGIGGILIIAGSIVFHIIERKILLGWMFEVLELAGILYLICGYLKWALKKTAG